LLDAFDNAKSEQIECMGLKPHYDGSPTKLILTLNIVYIIVDNMKHIIQPHFLFYPMAQNLK